MPPSPRDPLSIPDTFWVRDDVCQALDMRDVGTLFVLVKKYTGASQTQLGVATGFEQGDVSRVIHTARRITAIDVLQRVADGLTMPDDARMRLGLAPHNRHEQHHAQVLEDTQRPAVPPPSENAEMLAARFLSQRADGASWFSSSTSRGDPVASEWPVWFGLRLAHLVATVDSWRGPTAQSDSLQALLHQEILMFDAIALESQHPAHAVSRRQTLVTLAALPLTLATSGAGAVGTAAATEFFLSRCAASVTACWHLLRGSDLYAVDQMLAAYLLELDGIAQRQSSFQKDAAKLASQAHRICGIVALHRTNLTLREHHCKQALHYAIVASDISSQVSALISLANNYFYGADPARAAALYEQALVFERDMSPLQRSRVYAEVSVVYGQLGREQDTLRSAELAEQLYPDHPEQDRSYLYAEFTRASLTLEQGLAYIALGEQHPGREYPRRAANILARMEQAAPAAVPDRIRFEVINHQAWTAVLLNDLDAFDAYVRRGVDGVVLLESRQRQKEIRVALQRANERWPGERRLNTLGEQLQLAMSG